MARTHKRAYARYTDAFKVEAVRLASQSGIRVQDVAQSLDIHPVHAVTMEETISRRCHHDPAVPACSRDCQRR